MECNRKIKQYIYTGYAGKSLGSFYLYNRWPQICTSNCKDISKGINIHVVAFLNLTNLVLVQLLELIF